jgi:tetratricopeptide (TPR) repeat protein
VILSGQISAAELFEYVRPAAWTLSAIISACVLASTRHQRFKPHWVAAWTLGTLFFTLIVLPLYLIVRAFGRRRERDRQTKSTAQPRAGTPTASSWRWSLPALYLVAVLSIIAIFFYRDYESLDAHLWRANNGKLHGPYEEVIAEYRAALRQEDSPHTHKLLAIELVAAGRGAEALAEFRAAVQGGEQDDLIPYYMGLALESTGHEAEALIEYSRFINGPFCTQAVPDPNCWTARTRVAAITPTLKRK